MPKTGKPLKYKNYIAMKVSDEQMAQIERMSRRKRKKISTLIREMAMAQISLEDRPNI